MRTYISSSGESPVCCRFTNWRIACGDLENSVTFDSSSNSQETVDLSPESISLILKPPAPASGPCEIQLSLSQKYEIRQIYVRSTARAYEIYYSQSEQSDNEYLCTVRCSIAERDGKILKAVETLADGCAMDSSDELNQEKFPGDGNSATSEDDWVDVRAFDPPHCEQKTSSLSMKGSTSGDSEIQDFYEATAEINDSESCRSLTIRLLSLQNRGCVCIDEIYIFADPVASTEPENQAHLMNSSTGSTLMAMLVPTILQLSRSGTGQVQSQQAGHEVKSNQLESQPCAADLTDNVEGKAKLVENDLISTDMTNDVGELVYRNKMETKSGANDSTDVTIAKDNQEMILPISTDLGIDAIGQQDVNGVSEPESLNVQDANESTIDPPENLHPHQILDGDTSSVHLLAGYNSPDNHVEKILEQLLCRMTKIEEVCTRFEESMLRPMSNMEIRIQQVEQQLNLLAKNSQYSGLPYCRFSAPSFSYVSNSSSFHDDGCNDQPRGLHEFEKKDVTLSNIKPCDHGMQNSQHSGLPQYTRFLTPSFTCDCGSCLFHDDGHNYHPSGSHELEKDFTISRVPDSVHSPHRTPCLVVTAPEFSSEDDQGVDELKSVHDSHAQNSKRDEDIGGLKLPQDCPIQNPKRILIDDILASSLSGLLSESASHSSEDKQPTDDTSKNFLADVQELLQMRPVEIVADACSIEESASYYQILTFAAPEFTSRENGGEEYSDFQSASLLPGFCSELMKDDASSVVSNSVEEPKGMPHSNFFEPLADLLTPSFDSEIFSNDHPAAEIPLEVSAGDKDDIKGVLNPPEGTVRAGPYVGTGYSFDFIKAIEAIEPLTCDNIFSSSGNFEATGKVNTGSSFGDPCASYNLEATGKVNNRSSFVNPCASFNQDDGVSLI